jgi:hypothetical protein
VCGSVANTIAEYLASTNALDTTAAVGPSIPPLRCWGLTGISETLPRCRLSLSGTTTISLIAQSNLQGQRKQRLGHDPRAAGKANDVVITPAGPRFQVSLGPVEGGLGRPANDRFGWPRCSMSAAAISLFAENCHLSLIAHWLVINAGGRNKDTEASSLRSQVLQKVHFFDRAGPLLGAGLLR